MILCRHALVFRYHCIYATLIEPMYSSMTSWEIYASVFCSSPCITCAACFFGFPILDGSLKLLAIFITVICLQAGNQLILCDLTSFHEIVTGLSSYWRKCHVRDHVLQAADSLLDVPLILRFAAHLTSQCGSSTQLYSLLNLPHT